MNPRIFAFGLLLCACASAPPPPPPPPERGAAVADAIGPAPPPRSADWQIRRDDIVPLGPGLTPSNIAFSPRSDRIVLSTWIRQGTRQSRPAELVFVSLREPSQVERVRVPGSPENGELKVAWSNDGRSIAYTSGHDIRVYDLQSQQSRLVIEWKGSSSRTVRSLAYSPDDKRVAVLVTRTTGVRYSIMVVKLANADTQEYPVADQTVELAGWTVGESLALVAWDRKPTAEAKKGIAALDLETGKQTKWALPRGLDSASAASTGLVAIDPDGVVWSLEEGKWLRRFAVTHKLQPPPGDAVRDTLRFDAVGLAPDGKIVVVSEVEADGRGGSGLVRVLEIAR